MSYQGTGWTDQSARGSGVCRVFAGRRLRAARGAVHLAAYAAIHGALRSGRWSHGGPGHNRPGTPMRRRDGG